MAEEQIRRRLAAILAADVVGYSRLMGLDEAGTLAALKGLRSGLIDPRISQHNGRVFKATGDGVLAEFPSVVDAVACATGIQRDMQSRDAKLQLRIGVNLGDVIVEGDDIFGDGVNVAARLEGMAPAGGIAVSGTVRDHLGNRLALGFEDMGEQRLKNIEQPVRVFNILPSGTARASAKFSPVRKPRRFPNAVISGAIVVLLAAAGAAGLWVRSWQQSSNGVPSQAGCKPMSEKPSVAVLPFENLSTDKEQAFFAEGLGNDLINQLSQVSGLFVIDHNSVSGYGDNTAKPQQVACDLGVHYVLEGSVQRSGQRMRINVQLVDAMAGNHLWSDKYDRETADIFAIQDDVIGRIVSALKVTLSSGEKQQIAHIPTKNLEAYDYYLRAETENFYRGEYLTLSRAIAFYRKAIELDPDFAEAHAGLARAAVEVWRLDYDQVLPPAVARQIAYDSASRALTLDAANARAYAALALLQLDDRRHVEAIASGRRAVALNPNDAEAAVNLAVVLAFSGEPAEAVAMIEQASRLNPLPPPSFQLQAGIVFFIARQFERAIAEFMPVRTAWPTSETAKEFLAATYAQSGKLDLARRETASLAKYNRGASVMVYRYLFDYFKQEQDLDHFLDALKLAGFNEWPFGLTTKSEDQVTGAEFQSLAAGRAWKGLLAGPPEGTGSPFVQEIDSEGRVAFSSADTFHTGNARVDGNQLCMRFDGYLKDRWTCGAIYRVSSSEKFKGGDYLYLSPIVPRYFTPAP